MTLGDTYYQGVHRNQFDGGKFQSSNCNPTALSDYIRQMTYGKDDRTGSQVRSLVKLSEETSPTTPGWSLADTDLAASRAGVQLTPAGGPWSSMAQLRSQGRPILLTGVSSVFTSGCSAAFNGTHMIYLPPLDHSDGRWRVGDPICKYWRWEKSATIKKYAAALAGTGSARYLYGDVAPAILPDTDTEEEDVPGIAIDLVSSAYGIVTVTDATPGVQAVQIADRERFGVPVNGSKQSFAKGISNDPDFFPGEEVYVVGREAAVMLARQVKFTPAVGQDVKHKVTVQVDGKTAAELTV